MFGPGGIPHEVAKRVIAMGGAEAPPIRLSSYFVPVNPGSQGICISFFLMYTISMKAATKAQLINRVVVQEKLEDEPENVRSLIIPSKHDPTPLLKIQALSAPAGQGVRRSNWTQSFRLNTLMDFVFHFMVIKDKSLPETQQELVALNIHLSAAKLRAVWSAIKEKMKQEVPEFSYGDPDFMVERLRSKHERRLRVLEDTLAKAAETDQHGQTAFIVGQVREEDKAFKVELQELGLMPKKIDQVPAKITMAWDDKEEEPAT